ncbi:hypothetical protein TM7_0522 [candidate division TM7 genomosp. GTL1]|nr:hypothetical protein TM7_0522 [candidate division TM7 genomosp. GTL1]
MTLCEVTLIKKDDKFTPRLRFWKKNRQSGKQATAKADETNYRLIKAGVALDDCHENFWLLINFLQGVKNIDIPQQVYSLVQTADKAFVDRVLFSFNTSEARQLLIDAKKEDVKNLYAAVRHAKNKKALDELQELIAADATELRFQEWFEGNTWAFGVEYIKIYKTSRIGIHSDSDFIAQSLDQYGKELLCSKLGFFAMFWWGYFEEGCWRFAQAPEAQYPLEGRMGWLKNPAI